MARVYAIASAKGGVGKTTTTANLGATLAGTGADVVVIDGDIGMANLGAALGVRPDGATLHDVLGDGAEPTTAGYEGPESLTVVPGDTSLDAFAAADPQRLQAVVDAYADADYVLIDVGAGVSHETSVPLSVADAVVLVSTPDRDALIDTEKTRQLTERLGGLVAGAIITRTNEATPIEELISGTLTADVLTTVPDDEAVRESIAVGEPLSTYAPHSDAAAAYRRLATELTGLDPTPPEPATSGQDADTPPSSAHDDQLSDSLSERGVTIDADEAADATEPHGSRASDDHNVVNPFAATDDDRPGHASPADGESKWAEAATGSVGDVEGAVDDAQLDDTDAEPATESRFDSASESRSDPDADIDTSDITTDSGGADPDAGTADSDDEESVPRDAIPFGGGQSADEEDDADDESAQTTVLGAALEESDDEAETEAATDTAETEADTGVTVTPADADETETPADDDEADDGSVVIPDAEGSGDGEGDDAEAADDDDAEDDKEEKRGFFSRLFG